MSIHEIVKAKFISLDVTDNDEVDTFIRAISQTDEYSNDVVNAIDFDFDDLLHALATNDHGTVGTQIFKIKGDIRNNAINLYDNIIEDLEINQ